MNCKRIQELLPLYQKGLLDPEMSETVSRHLLSCGDCRQALEVETRISDSLDAVFSSLNSEMPSAESLATEVLKKGRKEALSENHTHRRLKYVFRFGAVAATVLLTLWLSLLLRKGETPEISLVQEAPVRSVSLARNPVRTPKFREIQRKSTITRLKENVIWISYTN